MGSIIFRAIVISAILIILIMNREDPSDSYKNVIISVMTALAALIISAVIDYSVMFIDIDPYGTVYLILSIIISILDVLIPFIGLYLISRLLGYRAKKRIPVLSLKICTVFIVILTYLQIMSIASAMKSLLEGNFFDALTLGDQRPISWILMILKNLPMVILAVVNLRSENNQ